MTIGHIWFDFNDTMVSVNKHDLDLASVDRHLPQSVSAIHKTHDVTDLQYERPVHAESVTPAPVFGAAAQDPWAERVKQAAQQGYFKLLDPEAPRVLAELAKHVPVSVFSNLDSRIVLQGLGIDPQLFAHLLKPAENERPKPHPDAYQHLIRVTGLPADQILYIGSDVEKDIRPAKALGIKTGIMWAESPEADYAFKNFQEVLNFVKTANR